MVCVIKKIIAAAIMRCKECKRRYKKGKKQVDASTAVVNGDSGGVRKLTGSGNKLEKRRSGQGCQMSEMVGGQNCYGWRPNSANQTKC